jgi:hypothetical protein
MPPADHAKPSAGGTLLGPTTRIGFVLRKCGCNAHNALCKRHGVEPPTPVRDWGHAHAYVDAMIHAAPWDYDGPDPTDRTAWMSKWPRGKQAAIDYSERRDEVRPELLQAMIKREINHSMPTKARLIQFYHNMATQAAYGPDFGTLQKSIFNWSKDYEYLGIRVTYASGMNPGLLGSWMSHALDRFPDPWFYERDGKNWDSTMQRFHHLLKMRIYNAYSPGLASFVERGFECRAYCVLPNGTLSYIIHGTVKSGHNDTTLGNSIINACIALECCALLGLEAEILVAGDDLLVVTNVNPEGLVALEAQFGITPEARVFRSYLDVSFISGCWLAGDGGYIFVPKLGRLLARLWWTASPPAAKNLANFKYSIVNGLLGACGGVPLYREFLGCPSGQLISLGRDYDFWVANFGGAGSNRATVDDLCSKYRLNPTEFRELTQVLTELGHEPCLVRHPLLERVCEHDLADLMERPLAGL